MFKYPIAFIILLHGLIHFIGFAKAFNFVKISQITTAISKPIGLVWSFTAFLFIATVILFLCKKEAWLLLGLFAVIVSQYLIFTLWTATKFGTFANIIILVAIILNYGSYHFPEKLIPLCIHNILNNKPLPIYGKGENVRDWLYVEDHARAIDLIFHKGKNGETYNIGGHNEWSNIDLVKELCRQMDEKLQREKGTSEKLITYIKDRAGHDMRYAIDASKLKMELGWEPSLQFKEGISKTIDWYLANQEWLKEVTTGNYQKYYEKQYHKR